jgi:putative DNA methylase
MSADVAVALPSATALSPLSLKDTPSFIEVQFPVGRLSAEAYKERKAGAGQTLTALGSYWKGRKPLILCRAVVLGCLLPATKNPAKDLDVFLKLMGMDDAAFLRRGLVPKPFEIVARLMPTGDIASHEAARLFVIRRRVIEGNKAVWIEEPFDLGAFNNLVEDRSTYLDWDYRIGDVERDEWRLRALDTSTYEEKVRRAKRPEECEGTLLDVIWPQVNAHLGTSAASLPELVEQLGIARFGHRPKAADAFCGAGSIPFEAARIGCDIYASDLNPIACLLTWGAFNIIGADAETRAEIDAGQKAATAAVDAEITRLGIEHDEEGNRAKAYLYCLETRCPKTGWMVPMAPSWVISKTRNVVAKLVPDHAARRYEIEIHSGVSADEMAEAQVGTVRNGRLVHPLNPERSGVEIKTIRGDYRDAEGITRNSLRLWEKSDFVPRPDDILQERLYCIQWIKRKGLGRGRPETFFASVMEDDLARERKVEGVVRENLARWQEEGVAPDMPIEPGEETTRLFRERGWTHWHHLFNARQLLSLAIASKFAQKDPFVGILICDWANYLSRLCGVKSGGAGPRPEEIWIGGTFTNQALNTLFNYGCRSWLGAPSRPLRHVPIENVVEEVETRAAHEVNRITDIFITDPPYADAIDYHEITEFFIAWLRKDPPPPFDHWTWDSRRDLAIKGKDEQFRRDMVAAYFNMTKHMPNNGLQVVMFTHQDAGVWADLDAILWAAGLSATAAWNVVTETESALKEGNYVQGTVCLVLRKRLRIANARRMEIEAEIEDAVRAQLDRLQALDTAWRGEALYTDGDLTLAAYAAALQVVTAYSSIDRQPLDRDLYRKLGRGERTMLRDLVDYAAQIANGLLVPEGFPRDAWRDLDAPSRFYVRMLDMEAKGSAKVADFQNFAKSFAFGGYADLMASTAANAARLAGAADLKGRMLDGDGFAKTPLRQVLFAIWKTMERSDPKTGVMVLRTEYAADYWTRRQKLIGLTDYVAAKTARTRPQENAAASELAEALRLDKV